VIAGFMPGSPPNTSDPASKVVTFVNDHHDAIRWQSVVGAVGTFALLWCLGPVWRVLRHAEGGNPGFVSYIGTTLWRLVVSIVMFAGRGSEASMSAA
jgi:hypothetical protein